MAIEREVLEFIIVPPFEQREAVGAAKERLIDYLQRKFPGYGFKVGPFSPVGDEDGFCVLPVMNFVDDEGNMRMCDHPKEWLLASIAHACRGFAIRPH